MRSAVKGSADGSKRKRQAVNARGFLALRLFGSFWGYLHIPLMCVECPENG
ncbi:MAG: hypothetical protein GDA51_09265 [Ekhidna sp.]|nr:hypothetical protein [Ekhidna sp.]